MRGKDRDRVRGWRRWWKRAGERDQKKRENEHRAPRFLLQNLGKLDQACPRVEKRRRKR